MGTLSLAGLTMISRIGVAVYVDGERRSDIEALSIEHGLGTGGATATLRAGGMRWDELRGLEDRVVRIVVDDVVAFTGLITSDDRAVDAGRNGVSFGASSFLAQAGDVYLGQDKIGQDVEWRYPRAAYRDGVLTPTGWTIGTVLRDIFGSSVVTWRGGGANIPASWRTRLALGSLAVLDRGYNRLPMPDMAFRCTTLASAIEEVLASVPTLTVRERFGWGATELDVIETGDAWAPRERLVIARPRQHITEAGANIASLARSGSMDGVKSRVIVAGAPRRTMISTSTAHPSAPLRKGWVGGSAGAAAEAAVLADPARAQQYPRVLGASLGVEMEHVFRRFYLPEVLRRAVIDETNALRGSTGEPIPVQVWKFGRTYTRTGGGAWTSVPATVPTLIEGARFDAKSGCIELSEPAINQASSTVVLVGDNYEIQETFAAAVVGITLTVQGQRLAADTGVDGPTGVGGGRTEQRIAESYQWLGVGGTLGGHTFNATWYFDEALGPQVVTGSMVVRDDAGLLQTYAGLCRREANRPRVGYNVRIPWHCESLLPGAAIELVGENGYDYGTHQVRSVSHDLTSRHATTVSTDNAVPMVYTELGGG